MYTQTFAEEDCEEPIVRTLLGLGNDRMRGSWRSRWPATSTGTLRRCPHLRDLPAGPPLPRRRLHWGGLGTDPFQRFDTLIEAESFVGDAEMVRAYGRMEAIECSRDAPALPRKGGTGHDHGRRGQNPAAFPARRRSCKRRWAVSSSPSPTDEDGEPFEVFGYLGKGGSFQHGVTELACRLISLHLRRGTPVEEVIDQMPGHSQEMQPFWNHDAATARSVARARPRRRHRPHPQGPS